MTAPGANPIYQFSLGRKPTLRLCSGSPRLSVFERQLSLMKTPTIMQNNLLNSPNSGNRSILTNSQGSSPISDLQSSSNSSEATLIASGNNLDNLNPMKYIGINSSKSSIPSNSPVPFKKQNSIQRHNGNFKNDVDLFLDYLSELVIGVFVVFGAEILKLNKDGFLVLVQFVTASVIRIGFKNGEYDSLLLQSPIVPILEGSNLPVEFKRSVSHLITTLQFYILFSTLRITAIFKNNYCIEDSRIDSLSIMGLGAVMILLCLNLIINSLPASRRYNSELEK
ncbi:unnamed protein product [Wickerhamomyces anomalus]